MKRRGFTLIELMVVIAIIIILAAIAIPNYLNMTKRAKNSRLQSDMATLATALETFKTDWGAYPVVTSAEAVSLPGSVVYTELSGNGTGTPAYNKAGATNAAGETNGAAKPFIEYIKAGTLSSTVNPFGLPTGTPYVYYKSTDAGSTQTWTLYAQTDAASWMVRTSDNSTPTTVPSQP